MPPPPSEGEPTARRPLRRTNVLPAPLKLMYAFDCAELPEDSLKDPSEFKVEFEEHLPR